MARIVTAITPVREFGRGLPRHADAQSNTKGEWRAPRRRFLEVAGAYTILIMRTPVRFINFEYTRKSAGCLLMKSVRGRFQIRTETKFGTLDLVCYYSLSFRFKLKVKFEEKFQVLANKILEEKSQKFTLQNKENITNILTVLFAVIIISAKKNHFVF